MMRHSWVESRTHFNGTVCGWRCERCGIEKFKVDGRVVYSHGGSEARQCTGPFLPGKPVHAAPTSRPLTCDICGDIIASGAQVLFWADICGARKSPFVLIAHTMSDCLLGGPVIEMGDCWWWDWPSRSGFRLANWSASDIAADFASWHQQRRPMLADDQVLRVAMLLGGLAGDSDPLWRRSPFVEHAVSRQPAEGAVATGETIAELVGRVASWAMDAEPQERLTPHNRDRRERDLWWMYDSEFDVVMAAASGCDEDFYHMGASDILLDEADWISHLRRKPWFCMRDEFAIRLLAENLRARRSRAWWSTDHVDRVARMVRDLTKDGFDIRIHNPVE